MSKIFEDFGKEIREEALKEGMEKGAKESLLKNIKALMKTMHFTAEQAMDALNVPAEERADIASDLAQS